MPSVLASHSNPSSALRSFDPGVLRSPARLEPRVLGANRRIVESGRDRMGREDVAAPVLQHPAPRAVQDAGGPARESRGVLAGLQAPPARLDAHEPHARVVNERVEEPERVAAAADRRDRQIRQAARDRQHLLARFLSDHGLELTHHQRIRMRAEHRSKQVVGGLGVGDPVAHRLVDGVLERAAAAVDARHRRAEQAHAEDIERLARHVLGAHVDDALESEERAGGGRRHAVLAGAGLGDDAAAAHPFRQQRLPQRVVDLVRARVREVLALEQQAHAGRAGRAAGFV